MQLRTCGRKVLAVGAAVGSLSGVVSAQWISFTDETATRMSLSTVATNDQEEKDLVVGDFDKDGWDDVVISRKEPFSVAGAFSDILLMNRNGVLTDETATLAPDMLSTPTDARDVIAVDIDGDTWLDLVVCNTFFQQPVIHMNLGESGGVWQGFAMDNTRIPFLAPLNMPAGPQFCAVWAGDLDGQNGPDLYFANYVPSGGTSDVLLMNDGTGFFTDETNTRLGANQNVAFGTGVEFHDVDNDGDLDIVKMSTLYNVAPFSPFGIYFMFNDGTGDFDELPMQQLPVAQPYMISGGDFDGDPFVDFYCVDDFDDEKVSVTAVTPDGPVTLSDTTLVSDRTDGFGGNIKFADLDNDGDMDVGVAPIDVDIANCNTGAELALLRNPGNGNFEDPWSIGNTQNFHIEAHDFVFMDVNNDGCQDIVMGLCTGFSVLIQDGCVTPPCQGDANGSGTVDFDDLNLVLTNWAGPGPDGDVHPFPGGDNDVDFDDLNLVLNQWGSTCP